MKTLTFCLKRLVTPLIAALLLPGISGCTTPSQTFALSSTPSGARVTVNSTFRGFTPVSMSLPWKQEQEYHVAFGLDGYEPYSFDIKPRGATAWVISDVFRGLFSGGIGGAVILSILDANTGVFTPLKTEEPHTGNGVINVQLKPVVKTTE